VTLAREKLIAHRGDQSRFPENTLESIQAALDAGAIYVETDVQLSRDGVAFLFHDRDMTRLTGAPGAMHELSANDIKRRRVGGQYAIPEFAAACQLLRQYPNAALFVEAKRIAIDHFGVETLFRRIRDDILNAGDDLTRRCPLISFSLPFVEHARRENWPQTGAIFDADSPPHFTPSGAWADLPTPADYVFLEQALYQAHPQWRFPDSIVALYETSDPALAARLLDGGADLIETNQFIELSGYA